MAVVQTRRTVSEQTVRAEPSSRGLHGGAAEQTLEKPQRPKMSIRPPEPATSRARRNAIRARSAARMSFRPARSAAGFGGRNLISGCGSEKILSATPTNEVTPTKNSCGPRETKRHPGAARNAKIALMGHRIIVLAQPLPSIGVGSHYGLAIW